MGHSLRILLALLASLAVIGPARADDQALDQLLARLGLAELRLHHMERLLARETDRDKRLAAARQLADAYAEQLLSVADDPERFAALQSRLETLLATTPQARTPAIEVVLLQAEYQRAEGQVIRWLEDPANSAPLDDALGILDRIAPRLTASQKDLLAAADKEAERIDLLRSEKEREAAEQQLLRQQAIAARASYFAGWAHYYLGVARRSPSLAQRDYAAAKDHFAQLLDLTDVQDYAPIEADALGLESIWRSRAAIGLGLAELGLNRPPAAARIFAWLDHASVPPVIRDQAAYWHAQGLLNAGLVAEAARLVQQQVDGFGTSPSPGKSSLCIAAIRVAASLDDSHAAARQQLIEQGIRGLARMRQFETLDKLIEKHSLAALADAGGFHLAWLRGRQQFLAAEQSKDAADYRGAAATLRAALAQPQARTDIADAGQARYYLAWCHYRLEELDQAARLFQESATALRASLADLAVQAAWMQCTCLVQLAAKEKKYAPQAIAALQAYKQDYPSSENAARADLLITRLRQTHATPEEALRELAAIGRNEPNYTWAQYEIAQLQYQRWAKAKSDPTSSAPLAAAALAAAERYMALSRDDDERRLKAALLAIDVLQAGQTPDQSRIAALIQGAAPAVQNVEPTNPAAIEYQYRRLQLAQKAGDESSLRAAADAIAKHGRGSAYELPALVVVARAADQAVEAASGGEGAREAIDEAARVYGRLVALLGDSPAALAENKNALAASSKLAQYDERRGRWSEAADRYARIVEALPSDRRYLRRAGIASVEAGRHAQALEHWRKLLAGLNSGSDEWLEAKYYQLVCLLKTDRPTAEKVWKQFRLLFPEVKPAAWKDKFDELEKEFSS